MKKYSAFSVHGTSALALLTSIGLAFAQTSGAQTGPPTYAVIDLGDLGGGYSQATGINNSGQVVGWSTTLAGDGDSDAFLYSNASMKAIATPVGSYGRGSGINGSGQVVGVANNHAFLYSDRLVHDLGTLGGVSSTANGINNDGEVVGGASLPNGDGHAFLYSNGTMQDIGSLGGNYCEAFGINNSAQVVGISTLIGDVYHNHGFLYYNGSMRDIGSLGGKVTVAEGINDNGQIVGYSIASDGNYHAFLYSNGSMQNLGDLGGGESFALGINTGSQVVGESLTGGSEHAFLCIENQMFDLNNLLVASKSGWTLTEANSINDAGQIVGYGINPAGQTHSFLLNPLPPASVNAASTVQASLPTYTYPTAPEATGLIFITHGWINGFDDVDELAKAENFVNSTSNEIVQYLNARNIADWQVEGYMWAKGADQFLPSTALINAEQIGVKLGDYIVTQGDHGWTNIHFIAHSAGAGMIQKATEVIKGALGDAVTIHCTFLDAYDGLAGEESLVYGGMADWADSYFVRDGFQLSGFTGRLLPNAYNTDVTSLDPGSLPEPWYESLLDVDFGCVELESSHGWPIGFYDNTIVGDPLVYEWSNYNGFGFPLSEEAGTTIVQAKGQYPPGNGVAYGSVAELGPQNEACTPPYLTPPLYIGTVPSFEVASTIQSITGTLQTFLGSINSTTGSPVWVSTVITDTNMLNYVSFNAEFTSAVGADGLLTVYWDTNMIGEVDESAVQPGFQHYNFSFPNSAANTSHVLGFHVDPFTAAHSAMVITNIVTGCVGVSQPFSLATTTNTSNGFPVYQLTGQAAIYTVQASGDLINWSNVAILVNTNGVVSFVHQNSKNDSYQFYRATSPTGLSQ